MISCSWVIHCKQELYLNQYSTAVGCVLSSSDSRNQTNSVYDILLAFPDARFLAPFVTQPTNIRSMIRVDKAVTVEQQCL